MGLGKKLKKIAKVVNPITYATTDMGLKALQGKNPLDSIMKPTPGPDNPFNPADRSMLLDTSRLDYLKDPSSFDFLKNASPANPYAANLPSSMKTFASSYSAPTDTSDSLFNDLLGNIDSGPTSTDQVYGELDSDRMRQILEGVDTDTKGAVGSLKSDFYDRGLSGPGMISDIEGNALAQAYGDANKTKAATRSEFATKELDRVREREKAARDAKSRAYEARYGAGVNRDTQARDIASKGALSDSAMFNQLLGTQAQLGEGAATRDNQNKLAYADILNGRNSLFAQLLNARDLGAYNVASGDYNAAEERRNKYQDPSLFNKLLDKINIGFAI